MSLRLLSIFSSFFFFLTLPFLQGKERKGTERNGKGRKWKEMKWKERGLSFSSFFFHLFHFLSFFCKGKGRKKEKKEKKKEDKKDRREGKFPFLAVPFLSKERSPDRVPRRSFLNLKGGSRVTLRLEAKDKRALRPHWHHPSMIKLGMIRVAHLRYRATIFWWVLFWMLPGVY